MAEEAILHTTMSTGIHPIIPPAATSTHEPMEAVGSIPIDIAVEGEIPQEEQGVSTWRSAGRFALLRGASNTLWIGGTLASHVAQEATGVPWPVAGGILAAGVTASEYAGSKLATNPQTLTEHTGSAETQLASRWQRVKAVGVRAVREVVTTGYAAWSGAMSAPEVNTTFDVPTTQKRRLFQSVVYGVSVGAYSHPLGRDAVFAIKDSFIENPVATTGTGIAGSVALYGIMHATKKVGARILNRFKSTENPDEPIQDNDAV